VLERVSGYGVEKWWKKREIIVEKVWKKGGKIADEI
jgi:hypothetical protein